MEQSPSWEANSHSANQEISRNLSSAGGLKVYYRAHKSPPLVPFLSQMNPIHAFQPYFPNMHSYIVFPSTLSSSEWSLPCRFSDQNLVCISRLSHECYMPNPFHHRFYHPSNIWLIIQKICTGLPLSQLFYTICEKNTHHARNYGVQVASTAQKLHCFI